MLLALFFATSCTSGDANSASSSQAVNTSPSGSTTDAPPRPLDYESLAAAYCKCAENTVSINQRLASLMDAGDTETFESLLPEAEQAFKDAMECCRKAKAEQSPAPIEKQKLAKPLKKCLPRFA